MVCSGPALGAQGQPSSGEGEPRGGQPDLLWLADLTGADLGLEPIGQDPEERCSIWENLVSLVDFQCPGFPLTSEELCHYIDIPRAPASPCSPCTATGTPARPPPPTGDIDYSSSPPVKPPYSYATLICMAMVASKKPKITLAAICKWISDNFSYYRRADRSWQGSIRHNLCTNKRFLKVPREQGEPGRGAFWKLHPYYAEQLKNDPSKEQGTLPEHAPPSKRAKPEAQPPLSPAAFSCGSRSSLEVGAELQQLLREFEEFEIGRSWSSLENEAGQESKEPWPVPPAEESWPPSAPLGAEEELSELTMLKGSTDWESLLNALPEQGEFSALGQLELPPPAQPEPFPLPLPAEGQQEILPGASPTKLGLDETLMASAFLEVAWNEEIGENLSGGIPAEQGAGNIPASLLEGDDSFWESVAQLGLPLEMGDDK